jgi:hypothetical protein
VIFISKKGVRIIFFCIFASTNILIYYPYAKQIFWNACHHHDVWSSNDRADSVQQ